MCVITRFMASTYISAIYCDISNNWLINLCQLIIYSACLCTYNNNICLACSFLNMQKVHLNCAVWMECIKCNDKDGNVKINFKTETRQQNSTPFYLKNILVGASKHSSRTRMCYFYVLRILWQFRSRYGISLLILEY